ncbi:MAG: hypothetical protein Q8O19_03625 [Rectinemataceae bacterium]|nr:hypothetical protein [Rectinemataceae bacterium]
MSKLTPRQNEIISEALGAIAVIMREQQTAPEVLETIRRALVSEMEVVTAETDLSADSVRFPSACG